MQNGVIVAAIGRALRITDSGRALPSRTRGGRGALISADCAQLGRSEEKIEKGDILNGL
jgi:hypothetical protein